MDIFKTEVLLSTLPFDRLKAEISETILKEIVPYLELSNKPNLQTELLSPKEAAIFFGVTPITLHEGAKAGKIDFRKSGLEGNLL